jgi:hypothetical protein
MKAFSTALAVLALAGAAAIAFAADFLAPVVNIARRAYGTVRDVFLHGFELAAQTATVRQPAILLVQAKAFVLRLAKRERPVVTTSWRMCPST